MGRGQGCPITPEGRAWPLLGCDCHQINVYLHPGVSLLMGKSAAWGPRVICVFVNELEAAKRCPRFQLGDSLLFEDMNSFLFIYSSKIEERFKKKKKVFLKPQSTQEKNTSQILLPEHSAKDLASPPQSSQNQGRARETFTARRTVGTRYPG